MDTYMSIRAYRADDALLQKAKERAEGLDALLSVTSESEIAALNRDKKAVLSEESAALLERALQLCAALDGSLDISIYPAVKAWGFTTEEYRVPSAGELESLIPLVDYKNVSLNGREASLGEGMEIDLGSVAKGWASDSIIGLLKDDGVSSALLDLGGNVQALGSKPDGSPWRVAVQDPKGGGIIGVVKVSGKAVITSGGYERYFEENGRIYWHIMDPKTCSPAESGLISATAVGSEGVYCDALSTALFVMGEEKAVSYWRSAGDFEMILVTEDGRVLVSEGLEAVFTPQAGAPYEYRVIKHAEN
ncbi:MAG: FAD:protein FMN transferase [Firmicutes bacterium]|nr:FAD:protein FMN transferase [Bacillota bacterium]